ncbi:condensin subunit ScpB [Pseudovibrio ascidiaceicola]|uniref:Condensin subunit ScpB n=1 Tax=Pseudovibrio ascidiaceicola TaxID=285279 RepID=A0A1I4CZZ3_9HYPH|nr:SMC-Scp complex subunit ScpB [Pseudovibrio ascidiaceicola]SFK85506.1 condensin subunit ScpB [Pseudovibrio ascidiaceicola]
MSKTPDLLDTVAQDEAIEVADAGELLETERMVEALIFASAEPLSFTELTKRIPGNRDIRGALNRLRAFYRKRGVQLRSTEDRWSFRTAEDLSFILHREAVEQRRLSRAALETLAIIAFHQPVTRAEIEDIRGVSTSKGTLDVLLETGWVRMRGRRRTPGRPVTYGTSFDFLDHFGLENIKDLPGLEELKGAGLLDSAIPASFHVPAPDDSIDLTEDEDPLEESEMFATGALEEDAGEK